MRDRFYSTADLARVCGVSISTIKRWTDAGLLRCVRTPGGHRKYRVQDVAEAARKLGLASADAEDSPSARVDELALLLLQGDRAGLAARVAEFLRAGDAAAVRHLVLDLHRHGVRLVEAALLVRAGLREVDTRRADSDLDAFVQRRAEQIAVTTVRTLFEQASGAPREAPLALVAAAPGVRDPLAASLVVLALVECGWRAVDLGAAASLDVVRGGLRAERTQLVVLVQEAASSALVEPLRAQALAHGADLVVHDAREDAAIAALRAHAATCERRLVAAMA